ncbi:MAG TPA: D-aminoacylase [Chloroflexota bacterium]|nr:D-aminoacylase [Chloroflexota bacterium]
MALDILIHGGTVFDGRGTPGVPADVAIQNGRIVAVGNHGAFAGAHVQTRIDAREKYVAPGFIDIHTHSDRSILINARMESKIRQGVTTEVGGNCGSGVAPALGEAIPKPRSGADATQIMEDRTWPSLTDYFEAIERAGIAGNFATWAAHGILRASAIGYAMRAAKPDEVHHMKTLLRESLEAGAFGLSTGLIYVPSGYADTDEIIALADVVREYGGAYASHIRDEGSGLAGAVEEAVEVGRRASVPVQIAHHKAAGKANWGKVEQSLALMERARSDGVDVACDQYPYVASSTGLSSILPTWALEGGRDRLATRLQDPAQRARIRAEMAESRPDRVTLEPESAWHDILIANCRSDRSLQGRRIAEIAVERGEDPFPVTFDLLVENGGFVGCVFFTMSEADVRTVMRWPHTMIGSDASSTAPYGPLGESRPHPRAYGTFTRVLGHYVREDHVLTWPEAIRKMTHLPASRLNLRDRGTLAEGQWADVVVFDPRLVSDRATFAEPHQYSGGIEHVLVNGVPVVYCGEHTGARAGRVLRRP